MAIYERVVNANLDVYYVEIPEGYDPDKTQAVLSGRPAISPAATASYTSASAAARADYEAEIDRLASRTKSALTAEDL